MRNTEFLCLDYLSNLVTKSFYDTHSDGLVTDVLFCRGTFVIPQILESFMILWNIEI